MPGGEKDNISIKKPSFTKKSIHSKEKANIISRFSGLDTIYITTNDDLKEVIESLADNTFAFIKAGVYSLKTTIHLSEKSNVVISGEGFNSTIINITANNKFRRSITIGKNVKSLLIQNISFKGVGFNSNIYHAAIGSSLGRSTTGVEDITIQSIKVEDLPIGISVGVAP